jgi:hypothetical protein
VPDGAIAAQRAIEVGLGLGNLGRSLRALRFQFIAFKAHQDSSCLDQLSLFDENIGYAAADL